MEKQEMTAAWNDLQRRALQIESGTAILQIKTKMDKRRPQRSAAFDLLVAAATTLAIGNFASDNLTSLLAAPIAALPALLSFICAILFINLSIRQLVLTSELDYAKPIVETQALLAKIRRLRLKATQWTFLCALPLWVLFPILLGQMLVGARFIFALNFSWIVANIVFGLAMCPVVDWAMKRSRFAQSLQDAMVGKPVIEAETFLRQIQEFRAG